MTPPTTGTPGSEANAESKTQSGGACHAKGSRARILGGQQSASICCAGPAVTDPSDTRAAPRRIEWHRTRCRESSANNWTHQNSTTCCVNVPNNEPAFVVTRRLESRRGCVLISSKGSLRSTHTHSLTPFLHLQLILLGSFAPLCVPSYNFYHLLLFEHGVARKTSLI